MARDPASGAGQRHIGVALVALVLACGGGGQGGARGPQPRDAGPLSGPLETYQQLGFVAGPGYFPAVAGFSTLAGPADSTYVLFGLSLPNSALRFQRDADGFAAQYTVTLTFTTADSQLVKRATRNEAVRIPSFQETGRTDESIVFQHLVALPPGHYIATVQAGDANSSRGFRTQDTIDVPAYGETGVRIAQPVVVYEGTGRDARVDAPDVILNPRHTIAYGGDAPRVYLEAYNAVEPAPVSLSIIDEHGNRVWSARTTIVNGDSLLRHALVDLPAGSLPLGRLFVEVESAGGVTTRPAPLVISISDQWVVANFEDVLQFVEFIATRAEIDSLHNSSPSERRRLWDEFWARRDPIPATTVNEYRDEFFQRVRVAAEQFGEAGGMPGWRTDRGEVYIVLGAPTFTQERYIGRTDSMGRPNAWEWLYDNAPGGRLSLLFSDRAGFGRFELTPSSEAAFRAVADRMKPKPEK